MRWALNYSVAMNGREREGWEGSKGLSYAGGHWLVTIESRPLVTSQKTLQEKKAHVSLFSTKRKGYKPISNVRANCSQIK